MEGKLRIVQVITLAVFGVIALLAVVIFATTGLGTVDTGIRGTVVIWGSAPASAINATIQDAFADNPNLSITYNEIPVNELDIRLTEALAKGEGPDIVLATQDAVYRHRGKFQSIPYEQYPASAFTETFARVTHQLLGPDGVYALPLYIDPVVLFYNRDILTTEGYPQPASNWVEMVAQVPEITRRDEAGNITRSGIALGTSNNVHEMKAVYSALAMQAGELFTQENDLGQLQSFFGEDYNQVIPPAESALRFYSQFGNVDNTLYSWNSAFARSDEAFAAGQVAYLVDLASTAEGIERRNPQIDFALAELPVTSSTARITYAKVYSGYITRTTPNYGAAQAVLYGLLAPSVNLSLAQRLDLAPSRLDALSVVVNDPAREVIRRSATFSKTWLDPAPSGTELILSDMIRSVIAGQTEAPQAVEVARNRFSQIVVE